jgi:hypothetical protein
MFHDNAYFIVELEEASAKQLKVIEVEYVLYVEF